MMNENILYLAICSLVPGANFELEDGVIVKWKSEIKQPTKTKIGNKVKELETIEKIEAKNQDIENHIYSKYTKLKQAQDAGWVQNFTTKLVANGANDLDNQIVGFTFSFYEGKTLEEILINIDDAVKPMYEKLVKVAVKNEWAYNCILAGKKAITDNTEADYPAFPVFK